MVDTDDPWPRRLAADHGDLDAARRRGRGRRLARRRPRSPTSSTRAPTSTAARSAWPSLDSGAGARAHRHARHARPRRRPGRPTGRRSPTRRSAAASTSCTWSAATGRASASSPTRAPTTPKHAGTPTASRWSRCAGGRNRFDLVIVDAGDGSAETLGRGRLLEPPALDRARATSWPATRTTPRRPSCAASDPRHAYDDSCSGAPGDRSGPARGARGRDLHLLRRPGDPRLPDAPARARPPTVPVPAVVYPHGGPTDAYGDEWDGHAQYFVDQGLRLAGAQLPRLHRLRARLRARQPRRLGRRRHQGLPGRRRLPAHARLDRRRPPGDLRRELRLLHGAALGDRRPRAPLPLRRAQVRRLRHRRPPGPRATATGFRTSSA